jgi:hypothetical protein
MTRTRFTVIDEQQPHDIDASVDGGAVRLAPDAVTQALGWKLEERGLCRGGACIPTSAAGLVTDAGIDLVKLAEALDRPIALDTEQRVAALAASSNERSRALASLQAPDFTLPDLTGARHSLSQHRGKKVLLIAHASW